MSEIKRESNHSLKTAGQGPKYLQVGDSFPLKANLKSPQFNLVAADVQQSAGSSSNQSSAVSTVSTNLRVRKLRLMRTLKYKI